MAQLIEQATDPGTTDSKDNEQTEERSTRIRARTTHTWLHRLGLEYKRVVKGVFIDGYD